VGAAAPAGLLAKASVAINRQSKARTTAIITNPP
jgi:hypothetical protein